MPSCEACGTEMERTVICGEPAWKCPECGSVRVQGSTEPTKGEKIGVVAGLLVTAVALAAAMV